jgi:hypothetical protein
MRKGSKCKVYSHTLPNGEKVLKDKKKYLTPEKAIEECNMLNSKPKQIHKLIVYKCMKCHFFHLGRSTQINENLYQRGKC